MEVEEEEELEVMDTEVVSATVAETPAIELDPYAVAVKALEVELAGEITTKETILKAERNSLSRAKDKASESGKNGYFMIQAKVAEFQKNKAVEQKSRVTKNKREFVLKMLPVVDAFRAAPLISTSSTDREISMHKSFGSLLESILVVFEKYGFKEYDAGIITFCKFTIKEYD
jgi:molecular chaperone GrpE (heat shock protein)